MNDIYTNSLLMGWLTAEMIAGQRKQPQPQLPDGVLISSDGYILKDSDGLYLIGKDDS